MPHLRELVKLHENEPFALIGINTGDSPEVYRKGLADHGLTWPSVYQGPDPAIARLYQVRGYPTYFLIDPAGKLVKVSHSSKENDAPIRRLLDELKARQEQETEREKAATE